MLLGVSLVVAGLVVTAPTMVEAQGRGRRAAAPGGQAELDAVIARALAGGEDHVVDAALDELRERADERATDALLSLTRHRRVGARRRAYLALGHLRSAAAREAVAAGLADVDPSVRSACARALGDMGASEALPRLFLALERGVHDAARSIGSLASETDLPRFHARLERVPLAAMLEGYARLVRRTDVSWATKQAILQRLFDVAGLEVRAFFVQWQRELPANAPLALRAELERSIRRIPLTPRQRGAGPPSHASPAADPARPGDTTPATAGSAEPAP